MIQIDAKSRWWLDATQGLLLSDVLQDICRRGEFTIDTEFGVLNFSCVCSDRFRHQVA
jgi:hypothetical protein